MASVTLDSAELAGFSLEFLLYGSYLVLFVQSQHLLLFNPGTVTNAKARTILLTASCLLFLVTSTHFALDVSRIFDAFIYFRDQPGGPVAYLGNLANPKNVAKTACYLIQTVTGDLIMLYRVYVVYGRRVWVATFPGLMIVGIFVSGIGIIIKFADFKAGREDIFNTTTGHWILSWFAVSLLSTLSSTCLIAYRIWSIDKKMKAATSRASLSPVIHIIVESAAVYSAVLAFTLFSYIGKSNIQFTGLDATSPTIGIVFTAIIVRLHNGSGLDTSMPQRSVTTADGPLPLRNLNVTINTTTRVDSDAPLTPRVDDKISTKGSRRHSLTWSSAEEV